MLTRLQAVPPLEERLINPETGQTIVVNRTERIVWYPGGATYRREDADAIIDALDEILRRQDEDLAGQVVTLGPGCLEESDRREALRPSQAECQCPDHD